MQQSPEITALILEWYRRIAVGDMVAAAEDMLTGESGFIAIGTDPGEWIGDRLSLIQAYRATARIGPPQIDVRCIEAYQEDDVAWAADQVVFKRANGIEKVMRHTFVLHRENGQWKVVHAHYSFGIPEDSVPPAIS